MAYKIAAYLAAKVAIGGRAVIDTAHLYFAVVDLHNSGKANRPAAATNALAANLPGPNVNPTARRYHYNPRDPQHPRTLRGEEIWLILTTIVPVVGVIFASVPGPIGARAVLGSVVLLCVVGILVEV